MAADQQPPRLPPQTSTSSPPLNSVKRCCLAAVTMMALAGCIGDGGGVSSAGEDSDAQAWDTACAAGELYGRLYAVAGPDRDDKPLVEVQLCPLEVRQLSHDRPFRWVASNGQVTAVVVLGQSMLDYPDAPRTLAASTLGMVVDDHLEEDLPGLDTPRAGLVAVSREGIVAFDRPNWPDEQTLETWDPDSGEKTVVAGGEHLGSFDWGPDGSLAVAEPATSDVQRGPDMLTVFHPDQTTTVYEPGMAIGSFTWGARNLAALAPPQDPDGTPGPGMVLDMASGQEISAIPAGWRARTWSPDGEMLLLLRPNGLLGLLHPGEKAEVQVLGQLPVGPARDAAWVE